MSNGTDKELIIQINSNFKEGEEVTFSYSY